MKVAFLGLGTMGALMAGRLAAAGVDVTAWNRSGAAAARWRDAHGRPVAATPAQAATGASLVIACVSDDDAVRAITLGPGGAFEAMQPGTVFVDHSTGSATLARELAAAAAGRGCQAIDAPVTGGKPGATKGTLTTMVGGEVAALEKARSCIAHYAPNIFHMGPSGAGQVAKMANQVCIAGILQSLAEGIALVEHAGLDSARVLDVLKTGSGRSWQMENRGPLMVEGRYDFGFSVEWLAKDLGICVEQAKGSGLSLPGVSVTLEMLQALIDRGFKTEDAAAIMRLFRPR